MFHKLKHNNTVFSYLSIIITISIWWLIAGIGVENSTKWSKVFPTPLMALEEIIRQNFFIDSLLYTVRGILLGVSIGVVLGSGIGYFTASSAKFRAFAAPFLVFSQSTPKIILAPFLFLIPGFSNFIIQLLIVSLISYFPIYSAVNLSLLNIEKEKKELFKIYNANKWQILIKLQLPSTIPNLIDAIKVGFFYGIIGQIVAEMLRSQNGLGKELFNAEYLTGFNHTIFACIIIISVFGLIGWSVFKFIKYKLRKYYESER